MGKNGKTALLGRKKYQCVVSAFVATIKPMDSLITLRDKRLKQIASNAFINKQRSHRLDVPFAVLRQPRKILLNGSQRWSIISSIRLRICDDSRVENSLMF